MTTIVPFSATQPLVGGIMIGRAVVLLMGFLGRIAGTSGIIASLLPPSIAKDKGWRIAFVLGCLCAATILQLTGFIPAIENVTGAPWLIIGGLIVGIGVSYSSGCTSGHGICGMARFSMRSVVATLTFMASTAVTVYIVKHVLGA